MIDSQFLSGRIAHYDCTEVDVNFKFSVVSLAAQTAVVSAIVSTTVLAMEPLDMKQITDADKIFFGKRLTPEQIKKLQQISSNGFATSKLPCDKIVEINKNLHFIKVVTPVLREASTNSDISRYARVYSTSLTHEFTETSKVFVSLLPRYEKICTATKKEQPEPELPSKL